MARLMQIDIDCAYPEQLAEFWAELLDYRVADPPAGHESWEAFSRAESGDEGERWCRLIDPGGQGTTILFHRVPEAKTVKNRIHLDVWVAPRGRSPDENWPLVDAEVLRLIGLGASEVRRVTEHDQCYVVMTDPEGNEFCACG